MTPENVRFHAAGHLAAAALLAQSHPAAASVILGAVDQFVNHAKVDAPPQLKEKVLEAKGDPGGHTRDIELLEQWFVDPFNTTIEKSGGRL